MGRQLVGAADFFWPLIPFVVLAVVFWLLLGPGKYKKIFSDDHILEVWGKLGQAKGVAIDGLTQPIPTSGAATIDAAIARGQRFTTSAGMTFIYTIDRDTDRYEHHVSMSHKRLLAFAAATYFTALLGEILSIDIREAAFFKGHRMIFHVVFELDEANERQFAAKPVVVPDASRLPDVRQRVLAVRRELKVADRR